MSIYTITIEPMPERTRPTEQRLKQWLKLGLRGFGLRCVDIRASNASAANASEREGDTPAAGPSKPETRQNCSYCE